MKQTLATVFLATSLSLLNAQVTKPNIIVFYVDDLGHQDVQINELDNLCPYETPNMIALAASGMNFPQAYSPAPTCSPSRAAIISGRHPAKTRFTHVTLDDRDDGRGLRTAHRSLPRGTTRSQRPHQCRCLASEWLPHRSLREMAHRSQCRKLRLRNSES